MALVELADRGREVLDPRAGNRGTLATGLVERNYLDEVLVPERRPEPIAGLPLAAGDDRLVHQVVTEHGRAVLATAGYCLPKLCLGRPPIGLRQVFVPFWAVGLVVTTMPV